MNDCGGHEKCQCVLSLSLRRESAEIVLHFELSGVTYLKKKYTSGTKDKAWVVSLRSKLPFKGKIRHSATQNKIQDLTSTLLEKGIADQELQRPEA